LQPLPSTGPERAIVSACSFSAARFSRKQQERQRRASSAEDSGHGERALESVGERGGKRSAAVEPDPVVGNPADQPDMREAEPWHHALLGEQNGGYRTSVLSRPSQRVTVGPLPLHHQVTRIANTRQLPDETQHPGTSVSE
jgi:hypothetical protein